MRGAVLIRDLVQQLGVTWSRSEQERRLFALCVQVQATLMQRYGHDYQIPDISVVPRAYTEEAKEIIGEELSQSGLGR